MKPRKLEQNKFVIVPVSGQRVIVFQADDQLFAFSAKCTHEGCTVTFQPGQSVIWCPCHDGRFDLNGRVFPGRRRSRWRNTLRNASPTAASSFRNKRPEHNDAEKGGGLRGWLDRRYQITPLFEFLRHKEVPLGSHWMGWYYLGGVTMFFFIVQVITGVLLLMYYQPGEATAYESIRFLTTKVPFGWLIRSIHSWSAHLMIISLRAPHVQHDDAESVPAAARSHLGLRISSVSPHARLRIFRLSAALEQARLFRHDGRDEHRALPCRC